MAERAAAAAAAANRRGGAAASKTSSKVKAPRTPTSCDRCKSRKTKCVDPIPGPCKYCAHIGAECGVPTRRKQRPFYHVTEEEYRCSMQILQHFLPSYDLSRETLRGIANNLKSGRAIDDSPSSNLQIGMDQEDEETREPEAEPESEEIAELHGQLGCLMEDSLGEYRYVGPESEIAFNAAVCSMKGEPSPEKIIIEPSKFAFPPHKPESVKILHEIPSFDRTYLPPRDYCTYYVARFFEEVHCVYWLYPAEQFHARLDDVYANRGTKCTASWLCSLYAIFALGAASGDSSCGDLFNEIVSEEARRNPDSKTSHDYLTLAKALVPQIHEEADIDSIRALAILSIALQTFGFRITSYLYMGTSIRIAFSLGLQHDKSPATHSPVTRQLNRRIWWTLYILDHTTASRCGSPCVIDERSLRIQTALPSEQIMNPGTNTPLGILSVSVSLCRIKREIIQTIYHERTSDSRTVSFSKVTSFVSILKKWLETIPSHLKWGVAVAPSHRRSIAILHLNYWSATILLTQPFLLYVVLRASSLSSQKKIWFENLADVCVDAAQNAMMVLKAMSEEHTISSLITFDSTSALKLIMVLVLALAKTNLSQYREDIESCVSILQGMEQIGFCKTAVQELPLRIGELGIVNKQDDAEAQHDLFVSQLWPELDHSSFLSSVENLQSFSSNPFLMDMEMFMDMDMGLSTLSDSFQPSLDLVSGPDSYDFSR